MPPKKPENPLVKIHDLKPTIWVGKQGVTPTIIEEVRGQIKTRRIIKLKWLASVDVEPAKVAEESGTVLIQVRGRTMVVADPQFSRQFKPRNI